MTKCNTKRIGFTPQRRRQVVADFLGGRLTTDAGALLLREVDRQIGLIDAINPICRATAASWVPRQALRSAKPAKLQFSFLDNPPARTFMHWVGRTCWSSCAEERKAQLAQVCVTEAG